MKYVRSVIHVFINLIELIYIHFIIIISHINCYIDSLLTVNLALARREEAGAPPPPPPPPPDGFLAIDPESFAMKS